MDRREGSLEQPQMGRAQPALWRNVNFWLIWSGQTISTLGTSISTLALPLLMLALTHSLALTGLLVAARQLPYLLFSLPAGALVDRWDRKTTMVWCDVVRWLALGSVPLAFALGYLTLLHLYLVVFLEGSAYVLFSLAQISALPQVVAPEDLSRAYSFDTIMEYVGILLGPALAAFLIGLAQTVEVGALLAYLADSLSYLISVLSLLWIRISFQIERVERREPRKLVHEIAEGLRFLWGQRNLRLMALLTALVNFLTSPIILAFIALAQNGLHLSVQMLGFILSAGGVGGLLGGLLAPWLRSRLSSGRLLLLIAGIWAVTTLLLALIPWLPLVVAGKFVISLLYPIYSVIVVSYRLELTPTALQGRVNSAFRSLSYGSEPLGAALGGFLLFAFGAQAVFGFMAVGFVGCALFMMWSRLSRV